MQEMENCFGKSTLTLSKDSNNLNDLQNKAEQTVSTGDLSASLVNGEVGNCSYFTKVKREHEDLLWAASMENGITNTLVIMPSVEQERIKLDTKQFSEDNFIYKQDIPEPPFFVKLESKPTGINEQYIFECPDNKISSTTFDGSNDIFSKQTAIPVKTEPCETPDITFDQCEIKHEEVDLKEEEFKQDQISISSSGINQEERNGYQNHHYHACDNQAERKNDLSRYLLQPTKEVNAYNCEFKTHLHQHENRKTDLFKCDQCGFQTIRKSNFRKHILRHKNIEEVYMYKCNQCDYQTIHNSSLKRHQLRHKDSKEVEMFKCCKCDLQTIYKSHLKRHIRLQHGSRQEVNLFRCVQCEYKTIRKSDLNRHALRHRYIEDVDTFKCNQCKYKTIGKGNLKRHILGHENRKLVDLNRKEHNKKLLLQHKDLIEANTQESL